MNYNAHTLRYDTMQYRRCGKSGLVLPIISLGLWHNFGSNASMNTMKELCFSAFDLGITHFDLANNYGPIPGSAENNFGKILTSDLKSYRDEIIISTKAGYDMWPGPYGSWGSRKHILSSLDQSLRRMNIQYVDIFYHHRMDPSTPLEETMGALDSIVKSGKALYIGLSNYDGKTMKEASSILDSLNCPFIINQNKYSLLEKTIESNGLKQECKNSEKGLIVFSPLAQGLLSDRYLNGIPKDSRIKTDGRFLSERNVTKDLLQKLFLLNGVAEKRGQTLAQMALAYLVFDETITSVLIGASKTEQIKENVAIVDNINFTNDEILEINQILT